MPTQDVTPVVLPPLINGMGAAAPIIEEKSASFTLTAADSGKIFLVVGATAAVVVTPPAINQGPFRFTVINMSDIDLTVTAATADTIYTYNNLAADGVAFSTSGEKIGGSFDILCNGTRLVVLARLSSSYQNVTVVDA